MVDVVDIVDGNTGTSGGRYAGRPGGCGIAGAPMQARRPHHNVGLGAGRRGLENRAYMQAGRPRHNVGWVLGCRRDACATTLH